jgi:hypothetical protein
VSKPNWCVAGRQKRPNFSKRIPCRLTTNRRRTRLSAARKNS